MCCLVRASIRAGLGLSCLLAAASPVGAAEIVFPAPIALNTDAASDTLSDGTPRVVGDGSGNLVATWVSNKLATGPSAAENDIFFARSSDGGATWTDPAPLNTNAASDQGQDRDPSLATDRAHRWIAAWMSRDTLNGTVGNDADILVARSSDDGATWTAPTPLNTDAALDGTENDERPAVAMNRNGHAVAAWQTFSPSDMAIVVARSTDAGATWSDPVALSPPDSRADWQASVAGDSGGHWIVVWRSDDNQNGPLGRDGDLLVSVSGDDGITWSVAAPLNSDAAGDDSADAEPEVATDEAGDWLTLWNGGYGSLRVSRSTDNGATWSPLQVIHSGDLYMPRFATDRAGTWVAAWHYTTGATSDIGFASSSDNGLTWLPATQLNFNPAAASSMDAQPDVAADGFGGWAVVWMSDDPFGGTGTDFDVLIATGGGPGCAIVPPPRPTLSGLFVSAVPVLLLGLARRRRAARRCASP